MGVEALTRDVRAGQGQERREDHRTELRHHISGISANIYYANHVKALAQECLTWATIYLGVELKEPIK